MNKPVGYDEVQAFGSFKKLDPGGYICKIIKIEEAKSMNGNEMLKIFLDIADGENKGFYMDRWNNDTRENKKYGCIVNQIIIDTTTNKASKGFKGFITSVEESNPGFVADKCWGDNFTKFYKDKLVGCVFGEDSFIGDDGKEHITVKPKFFVSIDTIKKGNFTVPALKKQPNQDDFDMSDFTENSSNVKLPF